MANTYLTRTPSSATNQKTWTVSFWCKLGKLGVNKSPFGTGTVTQTNSTHTRFQVNDTLRFLSIGTGATPDVELITTQLFRDVSAWYHIVYAVDTTQGTASNRIKLYVNGSQVTSFSTATYPSINNDMYWNLASVVSIGREGDAGNYFDGLISHFNNIDGTAELPTAFGEYDANGVWKIKTSQVMFLLSLIL